MIKWLNYCGSACGRFVPSGPTLLVVGILTGLAWPALADEVRPFLPVTIFIFVLGTLLRVDIREFIGVAKTPRVSVALPVLAMIACPVLIALATWCLRIDAELSFAMVLAASAPPSSGTTAVARMLGLNATVPLTATLVAMAIAPFTVPTIAALVGDVSIDRLALASRLSTLIGVAGLAAFVLRHLASPCLHRHRVGIDRVVVVGLLLFAVATMAGVRQQLERQWETVLACVGLAFGCNIALQLIGAAVTSGGRTERLTAGLVLGNRNVGLVWSALGSAVSPRMALFFAATQFPIYILPRLLEAVLQRTNKDAHRHDYE